jgi:hypothetical protein
MADRETPRGPWGALVRRAEQAQIPVESFEGNRFVDPDDLQHEDKIHNTRSEVVARFIPDTYGTQPTSMWRMKP